MLRIKRLKALRNLIGIVIISATTLTACKGTGIETAIAPQNPVNSTNPIVPQNTTTPESNTPKNLPRDFNKDIPIYPAATLQSLEKIASAATQNISTRWATTDDLAKVLSFYEDVFTKQQWQFILRSPENGNFIAQKSNLFLTLSIQQSSPNSTTIFLQYLLDPKISSQLPGQSNQLPNQDANPNNLPNVSVQPSPTIVTPFSDIATLPKALRSPITDLKTLGTITPDRGNQFKPNNLIQRREYARWLVNTNNRLYADRPTRQIRLADPSSKPTFADIPASDPDFTAIQGLINAGLIPVDPNPTSVTSRRFRPNDPVSREVLLQWKIPLDLRSALPSANLEAVKQAWGFQDSDRIAPPNFKFVLADFKLGDLSNIRRSFGYTTLFQPQKYVTRAEAAAALWYFGTLEDGLSVQNALQNAAQNSLENSQPTEPPKPEPLNPTVKPIN